MHKKINSTNIFTYLLLLTVLFFCMQISFFFQFSGFYLADFKGMASHLKIPLKIIPPVLFFISVQLSLHLLFALFIWSQARLIGQTLNLPWKKIEKLSLMLWCVAIVMVVLANQVYFPHSLFSHLTESILNQHVAKIILMLLLGFFCITTGISLYGFFISFKHVITKAFLLFILIILAIFLFYPPEKNKIADASTIYQPNIIFIGIDALRPDFLGFFGYEKMSPHLDDFLNQATVFSESLTPIARTFPAWVSILLGEYPKQSGIRTDLQDQSHEDYQNALPMILRQQGYETIFATDETRFSNIDERFGFDKVIVPTIGLNDFLLGTLNDFPLSNLLVNTKLGKMLFPDSYANRPAYATYDPDSFIALLKSGLGASRTKPLFLSVHFCLTHFPYIWDEAPLDQKTLHHYQAAVHRVDQQFADFLALLQKNKILDHAIIVVLSDHGEALELHGDRVTNPELFIGKKIPNFYPPTMDSEPVDESAGHGTDVLGLTQYHNVLAFRLYGLQTYQPHVVSGLVSLLDLKPTILDFLNIPIKTMDIKSMSAGSSLRNVILENITSVAPRSDFFTESDFSPEAVRTVHPELRKALFEGIDYFQLDPITTRFTVRKSMEQAIISSKQYADYYKGWVLALYPQQDKTMTPILVNLETGQWTSDLTLPFAQKSPVKHMLTSMKAFFQKDILKIY